MVLRFVLDVRGGHRRQGTVANVSVRPLPTVLIGMVGGVIVGMTSVGSGSLMIVLLLFLYPMIGASQLVGTDLTQAVPLTLAAALGALAFGHVELSVTTSLVIGSVPIFASGLKYIGLGTTTLGVVLAAVLIAGAAAWAARQA